MRRSAGRTDARLAPDAAATGTVMRLHTVEAYARDAGFEALEVLPVEDDFWWSNASPRRRPECPGCADSRRPGSLRL